MAAAKDMDRRKKIRALEAKRDVISIRMSKDRVGIAEIRAALKVMRARR